MKITRNTIQLIYFIILFYFTIFFWERMPKDLQIKDSLQPLPLIAEIIKQKRTKLLNEF